MKNAFRAAINFLKEENKTIAPFMMVNAYSRVLSMDATTSKTYYDEDWETFMETTGSEDPIFEFYSDFVRARNYEIYMIKSGKLDLFHLGSFLYHRSRREFSKLLGDTFYIDKVFGSLEAFQKVRSIWYQLYNENVIERTRIFKYTHSEYFFDRNTPTGSTPKTMLQWAYRSGVTKFISDITRMLYEEAMVSGISFLTKLQEDRVPTWRDCYFYCKSQFVASFLITIRECRAKNLLITEKLKDYLIEYGFSYDINAAFRTCALLLEIYYHQHRPWEYHIVTTKSSHLSDLYTVSYTFKSYNRKTIG